MHRKRMFYIALVCIFVMEILPTSASATEVGNITFCSSMINSIDPRATGSFNISIEAKTTAVAGQSFPLAAGETVTINASYAPSDVSVDFGLVGEDGIFHYFNVTNGSINKTILIEENGNYTFQIRNHSDGEVKVSGFVKY